MNLSERLSLALLRAALTVAVLVHDLHARIRGGTAMIGRLLWAVTARPATQGRYRPAGDRGWRWPRSWHGRRVRTIRPREGWL